MKKAEPLHLVLILGFSAVVITMIVCTYVIHGTLKRIYNQSGNADVVDVVEKEGKKLRTLLGEKTYSSDDEFVLPWVPPRK